MTDQIAALRERGVQIVRVTYPDLHGVSRGKDIPIDQFPHVADHGIGYCEAIMTVDLRHHVVSGVEHGFQDIMSRPDAATMVQLPWDPTVAWCLGDLVRVASGAPYEVDSRLALRRAADELSGLGLTAVVGPELEFYLCEPDPAQPGAYRRYPDVDSPVYTVGEGADPHGLLRQLLDACVALDLKALAANHEFGRAQYEINLRHGEAVDAADRAFRFKTVVKDLSRRRGLLATFIGKPWNDDEGSGFHLHVSLADGDGANVCEDAAAPDGLADVARRFTAGVLAHAPALMAFLNPTVNAYKRINPEALVPTRANWGHDNRMVMVRVPQERGASTRLEVRVGDGAANVHLATAATLFAGLDGLRRELAPPAPVAGNPYELPEDEQGAPLPTTLDAALDALEADRFLVGAMGPGLVETFLGIKRYELDRWRTYVTDWEFREYAPRL